ncbi:MAG: 4-phosphopantoate--beta-alanine ligase [Phycisphaerales bacterium]
MIVATDNQMLESYVGAHQSGCVFVPTMGALHEGHVSLVRSAVALAKNRGLSAGCAVSIFVNPTQFNDKSDFERYPKTLDEDLRLCREAGASCVYVPAPEHIYPAGRSIPIPPLPEVATAPQLEDAFRPGHFAGVCQVVARLFELVRPAAAIFGEKDWQQYQVIRAMVQQQRSETNSVTPEIIGAPTIREVDGLAMSSRNRFLNPEERRLSRAISRALFEGRKGRTPTEAETIMKWSLSRYGIGADYAVVRDAASLMPVRELRSDGIYRALITARVGSVRLLDNGPWSPCAE